MAAVEKNQTIYYDANEARLEIVSHSRRRTAAVRQAAARMKVNGGRNGTEASGPSTVAARSWPVTSLPC